MCIEKRFNLLLEEICKKNPEFSSTDQVFDIFAKAVMTGKLLKVARLIEKTFGMGSFREIGEGNFDRLL